MSKRIIWKFPLPVDALVFIQGEMPKDTELIAVGMQRHEIAQKLQVVLWGVINPDAPLTVRRVAIVSTGIDVPEEAKLDKHIGTVLHGPNAWHVFDEGEISQEEYARSKLEHDLLLSPQEA